jgi:hypothetical protein
MHSSSIKSTTSRQGQAGARPVAGAYGKEGVDRATQGKLRTPSRPGKKDTRRAR